VSNSCFHGETLDDVMRSVVMEILSSGNQISSTKGANTELTGVLLEITNPRARLSRTETRGKPFSCLGELCWYLSKTNEVDFISYYISDYTRYSEEGVVFGGYGPRLFNHRGHNQMAHIIDILKRKPTSRQAVIQLFDANDIAEKHKDTPCTCTLQFMVRKGELQMMTSMRSNDVYKGLPHDIFCFTMLQEILARELDVELGTYKHAVGSLHLYNIDKEVAQRFLDEGWQSTERAMPPMPLGNPWHGIQVLLETEAIIRSGSSVSVLGLEGLESYWIDLIRLLEIYRCLKDKDFDGVKKLRAMISSSTYYAFIDKKINDRQI
jgi:thymidylate synthase